MSDKKVNNDEELYELIYWSGFMGRGEYIRLLFVDAGVKWIERNEIDKECVINFIYKGGNKDFPIFACPVIKKGNFVLSQTLAIMEYLAKELGYHCDNREDAARCLCIGMGINDFNNDAMLAFHPVDEHATYLSQKEEADKSAEKFAQTRYVKWMNLLEKQLAYNNGGKGYFVGDKITYVDLMALQIILAAEHQFPEHYAKLDIPLLNAFKERISNRPNLKPYLATRQKFAPDSMT